MAESNEIPIEAMDEWVLDYLKHRINNGEYKDAVTIIESTLFYARDHLFELGLKNRDEDLINEAKAVTCLVNILRKQPSSNNWNKLLRDHGLPINAPAFQ